MSLTTDNPTQQRVDDGQEEIAGEPPIVEKEPSPSEVDGEVPGATEVPSGSKRARGTKKWLLVGFAGILLVLAAYVAVDFFGSRQADPFRSDQSGIAADLPKTAEPLPDFLVPLPDANEKAILRVSLAVRWLPEVRDRFILDRVAIRGEVYRRLREMTAAGMITRQGDELKDEEKTELEGEITRIFAQELKTWNLRVLVKEVTFL